LAAFQEQKTELEALGATVIAACVDTKEQVEDVANNNPGGLTFPMAYGVTKEDADLLGSWWSEDRDGYIQPTEYLISRGGVVFGAMYASGPIGRMGADEVIRSITNRERRAREQGTQ
jgi:peroxiredoxin|tara:strand:+ start:482 stop:832 length:351 start_codon:yes stop_codon:yes gene_type:complete